MPPWGTRTSSISLWRFLRVMPYVSTPFLFPFCFIDSISVGTNTTFPIAFSKNDLVKLAWRIEVWHVVYNVTRTPSGGGTPDTVSGDYTVMVGEQQDTGTPSPITNELDLVCGIPITIGFDNPDGVMFQIFGGNQVRNNSGTFYLNMEITGGGFCRQTSGVTFNTLNTSLVTFFGSAV